jgi:hypothetical protein
MNTSTSNLPTKRHKTVPIPESISYVPGYPKKLTLYRLEASPYWWVRYYAKRKIIRRTTKTTNKTEALDFAKNLFNEITLRLSNNQPLGHTSRFKSCAETFLKNMEAKASRGEITQETYRNAHYRLLKSVIPFFGSKELADIHYAQLEEYVNHLSHQVPKISLNTIKGYLQLVHQVMTVAAKHRLIPSIPHFPTVSAPDNPRGYFTVDEYRRMRHRARALVGKRFDVRKLTDEEGQELPTSYFELGASFEGRRVRIVTITRELYELIVFMVNSYIRPTDIKTMQNKHVEIVRNEHHYLRLRLPTTKKHADPIVTQTTAISAYERLIAHNKAQSWGTAPDDYVFFPNYENRANALKVLQRQFELLMSDLNYGKGPRGEDRTIYSLRHTCIMYRLMYGKGIDHLTLARNARTSPDMIDRFYGSQLSAEHNIALLQSRRTSER